ncbi:MAG: glutathione peroxidase, partial [Pseudomonadota bacterium]|nr:glutathione peroxidase [Pseudomonadota bacterium]
MAGTGLIGRIRALVASFGRLACILITMETVLAFPAASAPLTAHDFTFENIDGGPLPLSDFAGKTVLLVNTASMCGFTAQYEALQAVYDKYRDAGLVVLGVPSDDFGGQEYDSADEIKQFCEINYGITFPMTDKVRVKGDNAHPFYQWVAAQGRMKLPRWNFYKHVIDADGNLVEWFASTTSPDSSKVI